MLIYAVFLVLAIVTSAEGADVSEVADLSDLSDVIDDQGQQNCWETGWVKISPHTVCFEPKGNRYGSFNNYIRGGIVTAIKLEYVSGKVRCIGGVEYNSRWGCYNYAPFKNFPLDVIVTDDNNNVLFPKQEYIKHTAGLWYWSPFVNPLDSDEVIFTDYRTPFYFPLHKEMRIWYGEDLKNWGEGNNAGRVCVNVYARFKL